MDHLIIYYIYYIFNFFIYLFFTIYSEEINKRTLQRIKTRRKKRVLSKLWNFWNEKFQFLKSSRDFVKLWFPIVMSILLWMCPEKLGDWNQRFFKNVGVPVWMNSVSTYVHSKLAKSVFIGHLILLIFYSSQNYEIWLLVLGI